MIPVFSRLASRSACAAFLSAALFCVACESTTAPTPVTLLDTPVTLVAGVNCNNGGVSTEFTGTSGKTVAISATGAAALTPHFTLYAPDFATQLGGSTTSGAGAASLTMALTQSGLHHVTLCDVNGVGGTLRVVVTQQ